MKIRQLKRILSITVATAMLVTSIPVGSYADDMTPITEEDVGTGDDNESTSDDSGDSGDDNTGGDVGNSDSGDTGDSDSGDDGTSGDAGDSDSGDDGSSGDSEDSDSEDAEDSDGGDDGSSGDAEDTEDAAEADESADAEDTTDAEETVETTAAAKTTNKSLGSGLLASTPSLTGVEETVTLTWSIADGDEYEWSSTGVSLPTATVESGYTVTSYTYTWSDGSSEEEINNVTSVSALGTYTAKVTVTDDSSGDTVTVSNDSISFSIVMVKLYITYTQSEWTVTYDGNDYSGSLPSLGLETSDGTSIGKDTASSIYYSGLEVSCSDSLVDAGRYTVDVSNCTLGGDDAGYYDVANYDEMSSMTFVIEPKEVDITWSEENGTTIYTGSVITPPTATYVDIDEQTCGAVVSSAPETVQDVGEYTLTATISAGNYTASETTATTSFSVTKGSGTVTGWSSETLTYNGGIQYPKATVDVDTTLTYEVLDAESLSAVSTAVVPGVTYVVRVTSDNYELSNNVYEFTVDKKEITSLTWSSTSAAYTGSEISKPTATFVDVKGNSLNMDVSFADGDVTIIQDVRSYDLIAAFSSTTSDTVGTGVMMDQLYTITDDNATLTFEVTELEVEVSWSGDMSVAYDGTAHTLTPSVDSGFYTVTVESITKGEDGVNSEDVVLPGTYVFTASSDNDNITLTNNTATLEITKAQVSSFTWPTEMTAVYCNEKIELPTVTFDGVETDDDTIDATVEITEGGTTDGSMMNADTYELTASIPDTVDSVTGLKYSDLYEISSNCTTNTAEFTITPLEITLTADNKSRYYYAADPTWSYSVDGIPESGTSVTSNAVKDALTVSYKITDDDGEDMTTSSPVGSYTITLTATENTTSNYSITCNDGTLEIEELEISLTANLTSKTYGEKDPELTYEVTIETDGYEGISTDDIKAELGTILERSTVMDGATEADESDGENVGTYVITFITSALSAATNYTIKDTTSATLTIKELEISLTADSKSKTYGESDPDLTYKVKVGTDEYEGISTDEIKAELGTILERSKIMDDATEADESNGENVGTYAITFIESALSAATNYTIKSTTSATLTITKLEISLTADSKSKTYGESDPELTYEVTIKTDGYEGISTDDIKTELGTILERSKIMDGATEADESDGENVGTYAITFITSALSVATNYTIKNTTSATLTITELEISLTADSKSKTYGEEDPELTYEITIETVGYESISTDDIKAELGTILERSKIMDGATEADESDGENVGTYAITFIESALSAATNYTIKSTTSATLTITELEISLIADSTSKTYGESDPDLTYEVTVGTDEYEGISTDEIKAELGTILERSKIMDDATEADESNGENVGTYAITFIESALSAATNYTIKSTTSATLTITKLEISLTADSKSKTYGESDPELTYEVTIETDGYEGISTDDIKAELGTILERSKIMDGATEVDESDGENAGTYAITFITSALSAATNYTIESTASATLTITTLEISLTADSKSKTYGESDPELTYEVTIETIGYDSISTDDIKEELGTILERSKIMDGATEADESDGENAGTYAITFIESALSAAANYTIKSTTPATLTITTLEISLTADSKSKIYGEEDPDLTYEVTIETAGYNGISTDAIKEELGTILERSKIMDGATEADESDGENVGTYAITFIESALSAATNYTIKSTTSATLTIGTLTVYITAEAKSKYYGKETDPELTYTVDEIDTTSTTSKTEADVREALGSNPLKRNSGETVGSYEINLVVSPTNYKIEYTSNYLTILQLPVTIYAVDGQSKYYSAAEPDYYDYTTYVGVPATDEKTGETYYTDFLGNVYYTDLTTDDIKAELNADLREDEESDILQREGYGTEAGEVVGTYAYSLTDEAINHQNFSLTFDSSADADFEIVKLPVTITADAGQSKYYGGEGVLVYTYTVTNTSGVSGTLGSTDIIAELKDEFDLDDVSGTTVFLKRVSGENAGTYALSLVFDETDADNFAITYVSDVFTVKKLPVTITPDEGQQKIFGAQEQDYYTYSVSFRSSRTNKTKAEVMSELGNYVLGRETGEAVGTYQYIIAADPANFSLTLSEDAPTYEITTVTITSVDAITSRQTSFGVTTDLEGARQSGVTTKIKVEAVSYPTSADGILFSEDIDDYITNATDGIAFTSESETITVNEATYKILRKDTTKKNYLSWSGYLPAGTVLSISIVDGDGNTVSGSAVKVTVSAVDVSFYWDSASYSTSSSTGNYVISNNGTTGALALMVTDGYAGAGEMVELAYSNGSGSTAYSYDALNLTFTPEVNNSGSVHVGQTIVAGIVDTLNLTCESKSLSFYVDDSAFDIASSSISFANRSTEISITLPEVGTITSVTIAGASVTVSGEMGTTFTFPVEWSGENLITSGSSISVAYTDQAGHQGTGTGTVTKSSVTTPITFTMRPALNSAGYLNGDSSTLIISGTACACEPIIVTVAGTAQTTYATQQETWSDENGSWEIIVSMSSLPEGESFTISAEYADVVGSSYSITANYNEYVAEAALLSPVYEAMTHLSGLVEPGTSVALVINGDTQNYYELTVDQYGRFSMDNVPMLFADEDSFDIYVTDIAGNVSILHYEVVDYVETTSVLTPMGKLLYTEEAEDASGYVVLPVSASDFEAEEEGGEDLESIELPLLMGASYIVGTFTVNRTENGITVSSAIELDDELIDPDDYSVEDVTLLVFTTEPTALELKDIQEAMQSGDEEALERVYEAYGNVYEAAYGEEIDLPEESAIWIVSVQEMTILTDAIEELELYQYYYDVIDPEEENPYDLDKDHYDDLYKSYQER